MIFTCIGHAKFLIELENGMRIITDPYDKSCGYPVEPMEADVVLVSHGHHDHSAVDTIKGSPMIINDEGEYHLEDGVNISATWADHDDEGGTKRGKTLIFRIQAEGLTVAHLGDLGHLPTEYHRKFMGYVSVLMVPVGGFFTIDAPTAKQTAELFGARVVLPMHYKTRVNADWPIASVEAFTQLYDEPVEELDMLRVTLGDLQCQPKVAVLRPQSLK